MTPRRNVWSDMDPDLPPVKTEKDELRRNAIGFMRCFPDGELGKYLTEWPHDVYKNVTVIGTKMRWPRKYLFGGPKYGTPCPEAELLDVLAEGEKIDIIDHEA